MHVKELIFKAAGENSKFIVLENFLLSYGISIYFNCSIKEYQSILTDSIMSIASILTQYR